MKKLNNILKLIQKGAVIAFAFVSMTIALSTILMVTAGETPAVTTYYSIINDIAGIVVFCGMGWVVAKKKSEFKAIWNTIRSGNAVATA